MILVYAEKQHAYIHVVAPSPAPHLPSSIFILTKFALKCHL